MKFKLFLKIILIIFPVGAYAVQATLSIEDLLKETGIETPDTVKIETVTPNKQPPKKTLDIRRTGLELPRFVSIKRNPVNIRKGPDKKFNIVWTFTRKGLPVEIIDEYDNWRKIRDHFGEEGWIFHSLLSNARYGMVQPWEPNEFFTVHKGRDESSKVTAQFEAGVLTAIKSCDGIWCEVGKKGYQGYIKQEFLWGVYPNEKVE